ncbi:MAG: hypothetical protein LBB08_00455 [Rickettsiales bacterium]|nr:hypothetical protein [Rickettsiales bacterium]
MRGFAISIFPFFALLSVPAAGGAPIIATKKYVDSGLATRVKNIAFDSFTTSFNSFKTSTESFRNRDDGFATAAQGTKADNALPKAVDNERRYIDGRRANHGAGCADGGYGCRDTRRQKCTRKILLYTIGLFQKI